MLRRQHRASPIIGTILTPPQSRRAYRRASLPLRHRHKSRNTSATALRKTLPCVSITLKYVNMTDVNSSPHGKRELAAQRPAPKSTCELDEQQLVAMVELLFFAYRDFVGEPDQVLAELGFGRAHHRVLHFVNRNPGLRVADLLGTLKITKQSLARVLKQLVDQNYIVQAPGPVDRRERRLYLTERGRELANRLLRMQTERLAGALAGAGSGAGPGAAAFLAGVIGTGDRAAAADLLRRAIGGGARPADKRSRTTT